MSRYVKGEDRNQISMISLDDMIAEDNPVRVIDSLVESLDMKKLNFKYSTPEKTGRKPYNPKDLLKLYIYGYFNGVRTTRKLEKECKRNIEMMWLLNKLQPDDKTISNFRKDNREVIKEVFKQFSMLCNELGLYGKEVIAVDGSKFRANNSRKKSYTKNKVKKMLKYYEQAAEKYIELLKENDEKQKDTETEKYTKQEIKDKLKKAEKRINELTQFKEEVENNGEVSMTDPDSKHMSVNNNGTEISHNVQIAVDSKNHLVTALDVVSTPADQKQLHSISLKVLEELNIKKDNKEKQEDEDDKEVITVLADKGYYNGEEFEKCKKDKIKTIVSKQKSASTTGNKKYSKDNFIYDKKEDIYICPDGKKLKNVSKKSSKTKVYNNFKECKKCKNKQYCTTSKEGRRIKRGPYQEIYDEVDERTEENKELYKQRQMIVEHPFGTVKRALGFSYFLTRKNENVKAESFMHFFIYNLIRVINIVGAKELKEILDAKKASILFVFEKYFKIIVNYKKKILVCT